MEGPDAEGCVGMPGTHAVRLFGRVGMVRTMKVEVFMFSAVMFVTMGMHLDTQGATQGPESDPDEHDSHQPFTPRRDPLHRESPPEGECHHSDQGHARAVSQAPPGSSAPQTPVLPDRQRSHRRKMIRA